MRTDTSRDDEEALRCLTEDGVAIALTDFGGRGPDLLLVHATGFCAAVLAPLARGLAGTFHCWGLDLRAHGHSERPADGNLAWSGFALDVLASVEHLGLRQPLAFGHSCGGAAILLAEQARPGTFRGLYCFEPIVFPADHPVENDHPIENMDNPLSLGALRRRETFPSRADALANFSAKPPFSVLDPSALAGYVDCGFELVPPEEGGDGRLVRLCCRREDEAAVYAQSFLHDAYAHLGAINCPVTLACGQETDVFGLPVLEQYGARLQRSAIQVFDAMGHFGPMEGPGRVAESVRSSLVPARDTPSS
ncbi:MAG TPA: alpha/beta hydrolase [Acidimicrobiales bacterium]|nr:alpha/beta hydrolase [Acidimicrobiales bacterium]